MKIQEILLSPYDDMTSVRDEISWAKAQRVLLVFPAHFRLLPHTLELRLLQRHATALGIQLGIVTSSGNLQHTAHAIGIPVFNSVATAQQQVWETKQPPQGPRRRTPYPELRQMRHASFPTEASWRNNVALRLLSFSLAILAVLTLFLLFLPSASIKISPATRLQSLTVAVSANPEVAIVNLAGTIPAYSTSITLEQSKTAAVSGSVTVPDSAASGIVRFRNLTTDAFDVPAGMVVSTLSAPAIRFATTASASMAAGVDKTLDITVQAVEGGSSGNLPAGSLIAIEGELGASLEATNPEPTAGGTDHTSSIQTADDRTRLRESLLSDILAECQATIPQSLGVDDVYFPDTLAVGQILSEAYFPAENQTSESISLTMKLQCQARYASAADINTLAKIALDTNLPEGYTSTSGGIMITTADIPATGGDGITRWETKLQRSLYAEIDPLTAIQLALGRRPVEVARRLSVTFPQAAVPEITLKPSWWPWLPIIPSQITILTGD